MTESNENSFSFPLMEKSILEFWQENQIFKKSLEQTAKNEPYIFYDGPPFATGLPHHGHLVASTLKDIVPRYFTMKGKYVSRRFGWDCHGLPIEQEIDKKFGMSANDFVAKHGVKKYNDECRSIVDRYVNEWERTISRLGRWVDFKNDYKTMDLSFMESVWWVFSEIWKKGLIYQGTKIVPYSPALQTALSNFEATQNYQDIQDPAITILFRSLKDPQVYFAAWTTTPWTLPSNLSLCVHPDIDYVKIKLENENRFIVLAESRLEAYQKNIKGEIVERFKGQSLLHHPYEPLFPYFSELKKSGYFIILNDEYVTTSDGTGIVHQAPAFGEDDHRVMKANQLPETVCPLDESAKFTSEVHDFKGQYIKEADKDIIKWLKEKGLLLLQSTLVHSYPMCPRTDTPLIYRTMPQWYVNVEKIKDKLIKANNQINWIPQHIQHGRFGKWLEGAKDWAISRSRVWGTPLPIWINDVTGEQICMGSIAELKKYTSIEVTDLHRESVDDLSFKLPNTEGVFKRIPDVLDCWFESGSMPYAQLHYPFENKNVFEKGFPAEFIAEGLDQTRGWFYTLTVLSAALYDKPAFKNVIVNGIVLAKDGRKMSKRLKNYTAPDELMEQYGADALRLTLINSGLVKAEELRFTDDGLKEMTRRVLLPWYNSFKFFMTYAEVDGWSPEKHSLQGENILDRWIISKLQTLTLEVNREMESYRLYNVVPALFSFIEDLTNWYIRLNRRRFWEEGLPETKREAYSTLYSTLVQVSQLMAPFTPFLADYTFKEMKKLGGLSKESVHLETYPEAILKLKDSKLEIAVSKMQQVIELGRQKRLQEQIKIKTPLRSITVIHQDQEILDGLKKLEEYIQGELNIKTILYSTDEHKFIRLTSKPNSPILGKKMGKDFGMMRAQIEKISSQDLIRFENGESLTLGSYQLSGDDLLLFREALPGSHAVSNKFMTISMDCVLDQNLIDEGLAREMINRIQKNRKDSKLNVSDRIKIDLDGSDKLKAVFLKHLTYISQETLIAQHDWVSKNHEFTEYEIEGDFFALKISKL